MDSYKSSATGSRRDTGILLLTIWLRRHMTLTEVAKENAVWTYVWLWSVRQESEAMGGLCQGTPAVCRAFMHMVEGISRQGRLEGCHRTSSARHLIYGLESMR